MTITTHVRKVVAEDGAELKICAEISDKLNMIVIQNKEAYKCNIPLSSLANFAKQHDMAFDNYVDEIRNALSPNGNPNMKFKLAGGIFKILQVVSNTVIVFLSQELTEVEYTAALEQFLTHAISYCQNLTSKLIVSIGETTKYLEENTSLHQALNDFIDQKKASDEDLYSKFTSLLDRKKKRIQFLTELLSPRKITSEMSEMGNVNGPVSVKISKESSDSGVSAVERKAAVSSLNLDFDNGSTPQDSDSSDPIFDENDVNKRS